MQASLAEIPDPFAPERVSFGRQERPLELRGPAKSPDRTARADHAMVGETGIRRLSQDVADRSRRTRPARPARDVAVGRHPPCRD